MQEESRNSDAEAGRDSDSTRSSRAGIVAVVCAAVAAPINLRLAQISETGGTLTFVDLRGFSADLGVSLLLTSVLVLLLSGSRRKLGSAVAFPTMAVWLAIHIGNHEHISALGSMANWSNAGFLLDRTFLFGSALHVSAPRLVLGISLASFLLLWLSVRAGVSRKQAVGPAVAGVLALLAMSLVPTTGALAGWRQTHVVLDNLRWMATDQSLEDSLESVAGIYPGDLAGTSVVASRAEPTNVLLVILEGISGAYLDSVAEFQGLEGPRPRLPTLDALARRGYTFSNFVNHQRQTNRGVYSLLCGDLPKQITAAPKMSEIALRAETANCLPEALRQRGYETVFLQAARLDFMGKDKFMPIAGFSRYHGQRWFMERGQDQPIADFGDWGVGDRDLFRHTLQVADELQSGDRPWFLTVLTSGTHHPFMVPESFQSNSPDGTFSRAVDYLDTALGEFIAGLEARNLEDDTLVIFASDESFGLEGEQDDDTLMLSQSWGLLTALLPTKEQAMRDEPHMQTDLAISVLDYLGYEQQAADFRGRSLFRKYAEPRTIPFANTFMRRVGAFNPENELLICGEDFVACNKYALVDERRLFGSRTPVDGLRRSELELLKTVAARAQTSAVDQGARKDRSWQLIKAPVRINFSGQPKIFGNQYLPLTTRQRVEIDLEIRTGASGTALQHMLSAVPESWMPTLEEFKEGQKIVQKTHQLGPSLLGMRPHYFSNRVIIFRAHRRIPPHTTFKVRYSFKSPEDLVRLNAYLYAYPENYLGITEITIQRANLRIVEDDESDAGLHLEALSPEEAHPDDVAGGITDVFGFATDE